MGALFYKGFRFTDKCVFGEKSLTRQNPFLRRGETAVAGASPGKRAYPFLPVRQRGAGLCQLPKAQLADRPARVGNDDFDISPQVTQYFDEPVRGESRTPPVGDA
jgi:hypothetical protein